MATGQGNEEFVRNWNERVIETQDLGVHDDFVVDVPIAGPITMCTDTHAKLEDANENPVRDYGSLRHWVDERLIESYRRLSYGLRRRGFDAWTVERMGRIEVEPRARRIDPDVTAKAVEDDHRGTERRGEGNQ